MLKKNVLTAILASTKFKNILLIYFIFNVSIGISCKSPEYFTIEETILSSDAIFVGTVIEFGEREGKSKALIEIDEIIFGKLDNENFLLIDGKQVTKTLKNKTAIPYQKKRSTSPGKCFAEDYEFGGQYLFLIKDDSPYWSALNAVNEKVNGLEDPWVTWVKGFLSGHAYKK